MLESSEYRKDLEKQKTEFNDVEEPKLHDYELGDLSKLYYDTLEKISPYNQAISKICHTLIEFFNGQNIIKSIIPVKS